MVFFVFNDLWREVIVDHHYLSFFLNNVKNIHFCTYTSWVRKRNSSDRNKYVINNTLEIEIHAPVNVGCVRSFGTFRYMSNL
jgi:hypothetical protein